MYAKQLGEFLVNSIREAEEILQFFGLESEIKYFFYTVDLCQFHGRGTDDGPLN